jgi:hypothetical protein
MIKCDEYCKAGSRYVSEDKAVNTVFERLIKNIDSIQ